MGGIDHASSRALVESIAGLVDNGHAKTRTDGVVTRVEPDGTVWVRVHGSTSETPCARTVASAKPNDQVMVSISGGRATIEGNMTSPATDDAKADEAIKTGSAAKQAAENARELADSAIGDAQVAKTAATSAAKDAASASASAASAASAASSAASSAQSAAGDASSASASASSAASSAESAASDASSAMSSALSALTQLGTVEDVMGTLSWLRDHEVYMPATEFTAGETYFELVGGKYVEVANPVASDIGSYYVYDHQATMAGFVQEHLTLTERGLYITRSKPEEYEQGDTDYLVYSQTLGSAPEDGVEYFIKDESGAYVSLGRAPTIEEYPDCYVVTGDNAGNIRPQGYGYLLISNDGIEIYSPDGLLVARYGNEVVIGSGEYTAHVEDDSFSIVRTRIVRDLIDGFGDTTLGNSIVKKSVFTCGVNESGTTSLLFDDILSIERKENSTKLFSLNCDERPRSGGGTSFNSGFRVGKYGDAELRNGKFFAALNDSELSVAIDKSCGGNSLWSDHIEDLFALGVGDDGKRYMRLSKSGGHAPYDPSDSSTDILLVDEDKLECNVPATFDPPIPNSSLDAAPRDHTHDYAASGHKHAAGDITSGTLPEARGGTGVTTSKAIALKSYPVGAIYLSYSNTSPASLFGGTWTQLTGRFIRMANDTSTGGADSVSHNHGMGAAYGLMEVKGTAYIDYQYKSTGTWQSNYTIQGTYAGGTGAKASTGLALGGSTDSKSLNNMPAYQDVYAWRRTA